MIRPIVTYHKVKSQTLPIQKICFGATQENCNIPIEVRKKVHKYNSGVCICPFISYAFFGHPTYQSGIIMQIAPVSRLIDK